MKGKLIFLTLLIATLLFVPLAHALVTVDEDITTNTTWSGDDYLLIGPIFVREGATLTIEAGVTVYGDKVTKAALIVERGGKLNIYGTNTNPVVFTSTQENPAPEDWGGLIINGYSTINDPNGIQYGEGDTGTYGCVGAECNEADDSGTMHYFRVEYAGIEFSPENELNGIALQAAGSGTELHHFQVLYNKDDGIEMFGGTPSFHHGILTGCADDSVDWTLGWRGDAQFIVVQQDGNDADNGIEADNWQDDNDAEPRANPNLYNLTFIGDPLRGDESDIGMLLRRGTAGNIRNSIVMGFKEDGINIDDESTYNQAESGNLVVNNCIFFNNNPNYSDSSDDEGFTPPFTVENWMKNTMSNNLEADPQLGNPFDLEDPDFRPAADSPALDGTVPPADPPAASNIVATDYIGAVDPDDDWTRVTWTTYSHRGIDGDGDGYGDVDDCDDDDPTRNPGEDEVCDDGIDNDCDEEIDTNDTECPCTDNDGDGYTIEDYCGFEVDCDDTDDSTHPGAEEICFDQKDNDCDGQIDEDCGPVTPCTAELLLGEANPLLDLLREFRDTILARSSKGKLYTSLYYQYSPEVSFLLLTDLRLMAESAKVFSKLLLDLKSAVDSGDLILTNEKSAEIVHLLDKISAKASPDLRSALNKLRGDLEKGSL